MKAALLERLPSIGTYAGLWTHGIVRREPVKDDDLLTEAGDRIDNSQHKQGGAERGSSHSCE